MDNYIIKTIEDSELDRYIMEIWNQMQKSYEDIGGCKSYDSLDDFINHTKYARVAFNRNNKIIASATYRLYSKDDSKKMLAISSNGTQDGLAAIQDIIKLDIREHNLHYWVEASGAVEHYFKKYRGYPIPNELVVSILEMSSSRIKLDADKFHYYRSLVLNDDPTRKMMFGFRTDEIYNKVISTLDNYDEIISNFQKEELKESKSYNNITEKAIRVIDIIDDLYEEENLRDLVPSWYDALIKAIEILNGIEDNKLALDYVKLAKYLIRKMPKLVLHKLEI